MEMQTESAGELMLFAWAGNPEDLPGERLLRVEEVAAKLGVGRSKAYEMVAKGELPVVRIGTAVRVPLSGLERWIEEHTQAAVTVH